MYPRLKTADFLQNVGGSTSHCPMDLHGLSLHFISYPFGGPQHRSRRCLLPLSGSQSRLLPVRPGRSLVTVHTELPDVMDRTVQLIVKQAVACVASARLKIIKERVLAAASRKAQYAVRSTRYAARIPVWLPYLVTTVEPATRASAPRLHVCTAASATPRSGLSTCPGTERCVCKA
jgi:hypothetical protein